MASSVTTTTIVESLQRDIDEVRASKKLDLEKRINMITKLTANQLRAGGLQVAYIKTVAKLPEEALKQVLDLTGQRQIASKG